MTEKRYLTLYFENEGSVTVTVLGTVVVEGSKYIVLFDEEKKELHIMKYREYTDENEEEAFEINAITDIREFQTVCKAVVKLVRTSH